MKPYTIGALGLAGLALGAAAWMYHAKTPSQPPHMYTTALPLPKHAPAPAAEKQEVASKGELLTLPAGVSGKKEPCADVTASAVQLSLREPVTVLCSGTADKSWLIVYSLSRKTPILTLQKLHGPFGETERSKEFHEETVIEAPYRSKLEDYAQRSRAGAYYDRGHLVPAADVPQVPQYAQVMEDTFSLANIAPQNPEFNRGTWAKSVELATRKYARRNPDHDIYVYTGVSGIMDQVGGVTVPGFFYKIVVDKNTNKSWAYHLPNSTAATAVLNTQGLYTVEQLASLITDYQLTLQ